MNPRILLPALFGAALLSTFLGVRFLPGVRHPAGEFDGIHEWAHGLDLTEEQEERLKPLEAALEQDLGGLRAGLARERVELCRALRDEGRDFASMRGTIDRVATLEGAQQERVVRHLVEMRGLLTAKQKEEFFALIMREIHPEGLPEEGKNLSGAEKHAAVNKGGNKP